VAGSLCRPFCRPFQLPGADADADVDVPGWLLSAVIAVLATDRSLEPEW
jgi:hypothetical protein